MPKVKFDLDVSGLQKLLMNLSDEDKVRHVARSTALAGAKILRDEAKARVPVKTGLLKRNIYAAALGGSGPIQSYDVSWNKSNAPHGHLIEFGHWRVTGEGPFAQRHGWVEAKPFIRPAYEAAKARIEQAMKQRMQEKIQEVAEDAASELKKGA